MRKQAERYARSGVPSRCARRGARCHLPDSNPSEALPEETYPTWVLESFLRSLTSVGKLILQAETRPFRPRDAGLSLVQAAKVQSKAALSAILPALSTPLNLFLDSSAFLEPLHPPSECPLYHLQLSTGALKCSFLFRGVGGRKGGSWCWKETGSSGL